MTEPVIGHAAHRPARPASRDTDEAVALDPAADAVDERHMPLCRPGELASLWRAAGLADVCEQDLTIELPFASFEDYWSPFTSGQGPAGHYASSLGGTKVEELRNRLRRRLIGEGPDRGFKLAGRSWAVRGVRPGA